MSVERHPTIGRYEVVGKLATGGMAEILLARLTGPSGFERAVAIKRILPQFAEDQAFVDMFLDEARIAARINHPNVVHYQELGQDSDQLFLVMEYLEGESLASLQRRARSRRVDLPTNVAMHIVAEAAAGLNAAHEMTDIDDVPLGIVHRDISPQNIFVTYQGGVKVMDFGIAKAADGITSTEAGSLKGKFPYMSPEQAQGLPLDGRSDIFSLGIVLYELTTGHRLFRRATPAATLRAVQEARVIRPSTLVKDYPERLEQICLRALAIDPMERYDSAMELRNELLLAMRSLAPESIAEQELEAILRTLFADRMEQKRDMLRRVSSGRELSVVPAAEVDREVELPSIDITFMKEDLATPAKPRSGARGRILVGVLALGVITAAAIFAVIGPGEHEALPSTDAARTSAPVVPAPLEVIVDTPAHVSVRIESIPAGAQVHIEGQETVTSPATFDLSRSSQAIEFTLQHDGYEDLVTELVPDVDQRLHLTLQRVRNMRARNMRARNTHAMRPTRGTESETPPRMAEPPPFPIF